MAYTSVTTTGSGDSKQDEMKDVDSQKNLSGKIRDVSVIDSSFDYPFYGGFGNFSGNPQALTTLKEMVLSKDDQILMVDLAVSKKWDTLKDYYAHLGIDKNLYFKLEAVLNHVSMATQKKESSLSPMTSMKNINIRHGVPEMKGIRSLVSETPQGGIDMNTISGAFESLMNCIMYGNVSNEGTGATDTPSKTSCILPCQPGIPIDPIMAKNLINPETLNDYFVALREFANLVNIIPDMGQGHFNKQQDLTQSYQTILNGASSSYTPPKSEKEKYDELEKTLWITTTNTITGVTTRSKTAKYQAYSDAQSAYETAAITYVTDQTTYKDDPSKWAQIGPILEQKRKSAWLAWNGAYKNEIETTLNMLATMLKDGTAASIVDATDSFNNQKLSVKVKGIPYDFWPTYFTPSTVFSTNFNQWTSLDVTSTTNYSSYDDARQQAGATSSFFYDIFSFGGSGGYSHHTQHEKETSSNVNVNIEFCKVLLTQGWLNTSWFGAKGFYQTNYDKGYISRGNINENSINSSKLLMPAVPTAIIVIKKATVTASWSETTKSLIEKSISGSASFGIGPFTIGGSYSESDTHIKTFAKFDGATLTIDGPQIIAFIVDVPPYSSTENPPKGTGKGKGKGKVSNKKTFSLF